MEEAEGTGIVTAIKLSANPLENTYNIMAGRILEIKSERQLELCQEVGIADDSITAAKGMCPSEKYEELVAECIGRSNIKENAALLQLNEKGYGKVAKAMLPELLKAASLLIRSFVSGAPIVVRFHNDGDGSSGGIALYRAIMELQKKFFRGERGVSWQMNRSIAYTIESLYADRMLFDSYKSIEKPLVVITDFGTSPESIDAINIAKRDFNIIWLDHHMPYEGFPKEEITHYINVFDFGGDSNFTAGLLTCIFSEIISGVNVEDLKGAAMVSDYSSYADYSDSIAMKNSIILDFLTSKESYGKPRQMDIILNDREKSESTYRHALGMLDEAINTGIRNVKSYRNNNGVKIHVLDFEHVAKLKFDYPLPGRYSSKLQEKMETMNNGNTITVVHYGNYISVRVSKDIADSTGLLNIIERLKSSTNGRVNGGGHKQAASIRTNKESMKDVMSMFLGELAIIED